MTTLSPLNGCTSASPSTRSPDVLGGELVFTGTRVPVRSLFDHLEAGDSLNDFLDGFPSVSRAQAVAILEECWSHTADEHSGR